jgi:hypothetical protein
MYHELLHKKHGETIINGRRFVHTPEFRREEQQFEQYAKATAFLNKLSRKQRGIPESAGEAVVPQERRLEGVGKPEKAPRPGASHQSKSAKKHHRKKKKKKKKRR